MPRLFVVAVLLWQRLAAIARAYLSDVAALDYFRVEAGALCWDDLSVEAGLGDASGQRYRADGKLVPTGAR